MLVRGCYSLVRKRGEEQRALPWWKWAGLMVRGVDCFFGDGDMWACRGSWRNKGMAPLFSKVEDSWFSLTGLTALGVNMITGSEYKTNSPSCLTSSWKFYMEEELYSKQIFWKHNLIALIVKSSIPNHIFFFFLESKLYFEHMNIWSQFPSQALNQIMALEDCSVCFMTTCYRDCIVTLVSDFQIYFWIFEV